ncbi:archease [Candidatus Desantisbacteria bacterium CG07_land_8_20_14_0_80_39_15]|uniref:Protein archease n=1 Tax=Candidatus Desantisbacteria bacterium CG07_land_8_20_14_0_80_39_15 TaxID=1974549 RepID=A0A2M6ZHZ1_9BACT|nr:MAG: archease [Candidatus Desantisbacteria bacterium CG07_land_8_20_14_0_80_39_15]
MNKFKIIEHTADIGIEAYGKDLNELFVNAARGMFSIITNPKKINNVEQVKIEISQVTLEDLLRSWLDELLYKQSTDEILFKKFDVKVDEREIRLDGKASGEKFDAKKHQLKTEIKAVTYHQLEIQRYAGKNKKFAYIARVIFDV